MCLGERAGLACRDLRASVKKKKMKKKGFSGVLRASAVTPSLPQPSPPWPLLPSPPASVAGAGAEGGTGWGAAPEVDSEVPGEGAAGLGRVCAAGGARDAGGRLAPPRRAFRGWVAQQPRPGRIPWCLGALGLFFSTVNKNFCDPAWKMPGRNFSAVEEGGGEPWFISSLPGIKDTALGLLSLECFCKSVCSKHLPELTDGPCNLARS